MYAVLKVGLVFVIAGAIVFFAYRRWELPKHLARITAKFSAPRCYHAGEIVLLRAPVGRWQAGTYLVINAVGHRFGREEQHYLVADAEIAAWAPGTALGPVPGREVAR